MSSFVQSRRFTIFFAIFAPTPPDGIYPDGAIFPYVSTT
jgi:hypothetical protein